MGFSDSADHAGIIASMENVLSFQALFFRHFTIPVEEQFGEEGSMVISAALRRYGRWRGEQMAARHKEAGLPLDAESLVLHWDFADWHCFGHLGTGSVRGNPTQATVAMAATPMWDYFRSAGMIALARRYYAAIYPAIAEGYGITVEIPPTGPDMLSDWIVTWRTIDQRELPGRDLRSSTLEDPEQAVALLKWSSQLNGALYYFLADETTRHFDMEGEAVIRASIRQLALERAAAQREKHEAAGWPIDLVTLQNHWDGDFVSLWEFDEGILTPGTWHQDCVSCPYFDVWSRFGKRGLALGYIYDYELHPTLYRAYHPDAVVQFESIKTRGDASCGFRVSIPSLQEADEPHFAGYRGQDT